MAYKGLIVPLVVLVAYLNPPGIFNFCTNPQFSCALQSVIVTQALAAGPASGRSDLNPKNNRKGAAMSKERKVISSDKAPPAVGPYSQGVQAGHFLFLSGQIPLNAAGELQQGDIVVQTVQVLENIKALLAEAGLSLADVVKTTVFLTDLANFAEMNRVYAEYFPQAPPARSTIQVAALPKGADIEIEVIAFRK